MNYIYYWQNISYLEESVFLRDKLEHSTYKYKNNNLGENVVKCFLTGAKKYDGNILPKI